MDSFHIFTLEAFFFTRARKYHEIFVANWMTFHVKISSFRVTRLRWIVERRFQRWFESNFCAFNFATIVKVFEALRDVASFAGRSLLGDVHSCNSIDGFCYSLSLCFYRKLEFPVLFTFCGERIII